jgi:hypothetical protein
MSVCRIMGVISPKPKRSAKRQKAVEVEEKHWEKMYENKRRKARRVRT